MSTEEIKVQTPKQIHEDNAGDPEYDALYDEVMHDKDRRFRLVLALVTATDPSDGFNADALLADANIILKAIKGCEKEALGELTQAYSKFS